MDLGEWVGRIWRKIFRTRMFLQFHWHLMQIWVLHRVYTLNEKDKDLQEEICKELKNTYTHSQKNWKLKFLVFGTLSEQIQLWGIAKILLKEESLKGIPDHDSHCTEEGSNPSYNLSKTCSGSSEVSQHQGIFPKEKLCINSRCRGDGDVAWDSMNKFTWEMLYKYLKWKKNLT